MTVLVIIVSLLIAAVSHEAAHALVMRRLGVRIARAGLGAPIAPMLTIPPRGRRTFTLTLSPWLVLAYVEPRGKDADRLAGMPYRERAWAYNAGIIVNLASGLLAFGVMSVAHRPVVAAVTVGLAAATWFGQRFVCAYVLPALAPVVALVTMWAVGASWANGETGAGFAGLGKLVDPGWSGAVWFFATVSISLGMLNALPLSGLDNGRVVEILLGRWVRERGLSIYRWTGTATVLSLMVFAVGSDLWAMARGLFG